MDATQPAIGHAAHAARSAPHVRDALARRISSALMACAAVVAILAGLLTALLAFADAAGVIVGLDLLAVWIVGELLRSTRRRRPPAARSH
jgi:hypothetical protein